MLKNILLTSFIYVIILVILTLLMTKLKGAYLPLTVILSLVFAGFIIKEVFKKLRTEDKPQQELIYNTITGTSLDSLKSISTKPWLFGIENHFISKEEFYYSDSCFYAISKNGQAVFPLTDITEISKTSTQINNRRIWQVKIKQDGEKELVFRFAHNYTLWNKNFVSFYEKVKQLNPAAIKSQWSLWTM